MAEEKLTLKSSQGEIFEVEPEAACMSTLIKNMVDDSGTDEEIPLPNVKTAILSKAPWWSYRHFALNAEHFCNTGTTRSAG